MKKWKPKYVEPHTPDMRSIKSHLINTPDVLNPRCILLKVQTLNLYEWVTASGFSSILRILCNCIIRRYIYIYDHFVKRLVILDLMMRVML